MDRFKSTLLPIIAGFELPTKGRVIWGKRAPRWKTMFVGRRSGGTAVSSWRTAWNCGSGPDLETDLRLACDWSSFPPVLPWANGVCRRSL